MEKLESLEVDASVAWLREKRSVPAVLKSKLAGIRSFAAEMLVFAVEGLDDKTIYYHWLKQTTPMLNYEVIVCNGKGKLLEFRALLQRDKSNLKDRVYFLADNDFDGLRGQAPGQDIYLTEAYSVENHLVNGDALDDLLKVELGCDSEPACRAEVVKRFKSLYEKFLGITKEHNQRIFVAKRVGINNSKPFPNRINLLATVTLNDVIPSGVKLEECIVLEREPTAEEIAVIKLDFDMLQPSLQYRGKFALAFFFKFLDIVAVDRAREGSVLFAGLAPKGANGRLPLDAIAGKSVAPQRFKDFVNAVLSSLATPPLMVAAGVVH